MCCAEWKICARQYDGKGSENLARKLATELQRLEPFNGVALFSDDLRLPDQAKRHEAHEEDANREGEVGVRLSRGEAKGADQPGHF
jgi:hypothetical protein